MTFTPIVCHTIEEHTKATTDYAPNGDLWKGKVIESTNMYKLFRGISQENLRAENYLKTLQDEFIPDKTEVFIDEWERVLGIPDDCFNGEGDLETRRRNVLIKLASLGVQTVDDFQDLANLFGVTAIVYPGEEAPTTPPVPKFTIVVEFVTTSGFPFTFPFTFGDDTIAILECLFKKLRPANCDVVFQQIT